VFRIKNIIQLGSVSSLVVLLATTASFAQKDDLFDKVGKALAGPALGKKSSQDDPFSPENELKEESTGTRSNQAADKPGVRKTSVDSFDRLVEFQGTVEPGRVRRGQTVKLTLRGTPAAGYHTYPLTKRAAGPAHDEAFAPKWVYQATPGLLPLWP